MKKFIAIFLVLTVFITVSCANNNEGLEKKMLTITKTDGTTITLDTEIARTEEEKNFGYMERENIPEGTGMLFVFDRDQIMNFWMKNTPTALTIAYIDSRGTIREMYDMTPFSLAGVTGTVSCRYALEVPQGWFKKNDIEVGSKVNVDIVDK